MAAIVLAVLGGGNARDFNTGSPGESYGPQPLIAEHDPDLAPAPYHFVDVTEMVAQIEATPTPAAIATTTVTAAASTPALSSPASGLENCPPLIVDTFGEHAPAACAVVACESGFNPSAIGDNGASLGLFQVQPRWHQATADRLFGAGASLLDPSVNVGVSYVISSGGTDWSAWTCKP